MGSTLPSSRATTTHRRAGEAEGSAKAAQQERGKRQTGQQQAGQGECVRPPAGYLCD
ncbi:hypothetical protein ACPCHT_34120 [Nucisporomicrobium flavum]|jgi:hypothetical protein|uniref:hypothetical protein n=1 Tax=Nucisporomicrobium flavum TaxID=2785915 RepID=UPI0018F5911B|nr:hypothetical protein [Nucisporomicrobium flavum]